MDRRRLVGIGLVLALVTLAVVGCGKRHQSQQVSFDLDFSQPANGPGLEMASYHGKDYQQGIHVPILVD